jgi:hypothetical protein
MKSDREKARDRQFGKMLLVVLVGGAAAVIGAGMGANSLWIALAVAGALVCILFALTMTAMFVSDQLDLLESKIESGAG